MHNNQGDNPLENQLYIERYKELLALFLAKCKSILVSITHNFVTIVTGFRTPLNENREFARSLSEQFKASGRKLTTKGTLSGMCYHSLMIQCSRGAISLFARNTLPILTKAALLSIFLQGTRRVCNLRLTSSRCKGSRTLVLAHSQV